MRHLYKSPIGLLEIYIQDQKIHSLKKSNKKRTSYGPFNSKDWELLQRVLDFLDDYFLRNKIQPQKFPCVLRGTEFQKKVWSFLQKIPFGQTYTYSEVACKIGSKMATRAVGSACGKNPCLILIPCHRVVAQEGLGGFALGLYAKKKLLSYESASSRL